MTSMKKPLIAITASIFPRDPLRPIFKDKALHYVEEKMCSWPQAHDFLTFLLPAMQDRAAIREHLSQVEGVLLQGGTDVSPEIYGEMPIKPEWAGDPVRDAYEKMVIEVALDMDKPILGICRGIQILNAALGGSLYQDISHQVPGSLVHRDWDRYESNHHDVVFREGGRLARIYDSAVTMKVNSIHHQGIRELAPELRWEAKSPKDGILEAVSWKKDERFVMAVQWHPEFQRVGEDLLPSAPLLDAFKESILQRRR